MKIGMYLIAVGISFLTVEGCSNEDLGARKPLSPQKQSSPNSDSDEFERPRSELNNESLFSYEYAGRNCVTGKQLPKNKKEYCDSLLSDSLNNNCAKQLRIEAYMQSCTDSKNTYPGYLSFNSSARCVVSGVDLKGRTFFDNVNPFKPQRRQSFRDIFWTAKSQRNYNIFMGFTDIFGEANFKLSPAKIFEPPAGQLEFIQQKGTNHFYAKSNLGGLIRSVVTNFKTQKEVEAVCISSEFFRQPKKDLRHIRCEFTFEKSNHPRQEEFLNWELQVPVEKVLPRGSRNELISVRLLPAAADREELIEVEMKLAGSKKKIYAQSNLNEGLEVIHTDAKEESFLLVNCSAASK